MKKHLTLSLLGFIVAGLQLSLKAEPLTVTSPYPEEKTLIDYNFIFSPGDLDGFWEGTFGPQYSQYDLAARNDAPPIVVDMLEKQYQTIIKKQGYISKNIVENLFPSYSYGTFTLTPTKIIDTSNYGMGGIFYRHSYLGNPLTTTASHGRLDVVKAIVEWMKQKLEQNNAINKLQEALSAPAINFGVKKTKGCMIIGTALVFALVNEEYEIVQYLLDQGAKPEGALVQKGSFSSNSDGDAKLAQIICPTNDGIVMDPEDILIAQRILDAEKIGKLKLDQKTKTSLEKAESERIKNIEQQAQEKIAQEKKAHAEKEKLEHYFKEQERADKNRRLRILETALKTSKETLLSAAQKDLLHDAGKAVWLYPEFFEKVLKERPDLADIIAERAIGFAGAFNNYEQTPAEKMSARATEMHNKLVAIRTQAGAPEGPGFTPPSHPLPPPNM